MKFDPASCITSFGMAVYRACFSEEENMLISPLSLMIALGMVLNGADEQAKEEVLRLTGTFVREKDFHEALTKLMHALPSDQDTSFSFADALFYKEGLRVKKRFIKALEKQYDATVRSMVFDESAAKEINEWVNDHTHGMIDRIIDGASPEAVLYLINALAFEGEWQKIYETSDVRPGIFTNYKKEEQNAQFMWSYEDIYIENDRCTGFVKPYKGGTYFFAAFLPKEGVTLQALTESFSGEDPVSVIRSARAERCRTALPKFKSDYSKLMNDVLYQCGYRRVLAPDADYSGIVKGYHGLGDILHKTHIEVDEKGTRAGAVTAVMVKSAMPMPMPEIVLDRPFIYMIGETKSAVPMFLGQTVTI